MVTELPGGGGDSGGRGGTSVGVVVGVPIPWLGVAVGKIVPVGEEVAVTDLDGVWVADAVDVAEPE
jgi:hypothetical protein